MINAPRFLPALPVAALVLLTVVNADADAGARRPGPGASPTRRATAAPAVHLVRRRVVRKGTPNGLPKPNFGPTVAKLRVTLELLAKSELDYQGHRVAAMNDVGSAILHLEPHRPGAELPNPALSYSAGGKAKGTGTKSSMPRGTSDGYLRDARKALKAVDLHLSISAVNATQGRAAAAVEKAMSELDSALALDTP